MKESGLAYVRDRNLEALQAVFLLWMFLSKNGTTIIIILVENMSKICIHWFDYISSFVLFSITIHWYTIFMASI